MRPIDADALYLKHKSHADLFKGSEIHDDIVRRDEATMALAEILNAPTIEPEVRRGRWIDWSMWGESRYQCSECNCEMKYKTNFCPKCGARMDGGA